MLENVFHPCPRGIQFLKKLEVISPEGAEEFPNIHLLASTVFYSLSCDCPWQLFYRHGEDLNCG